MVKFTICFPHVLMVRSQFLPKSRPSASFNCNNMISNIFYIYFLFVLFNTFLKLYFIQPTANYQNLILFLNQGFPICPHGPPSSIKILSKSLSFTVENHYLSHGCWKLSIDPSLNNTEIEQDHFNLPGLTILPAAMVGNNTLFKVSVFLKGINEID